jgi:Contractile injection system tube protein
MVMDAVGSAASAVGDALGLIKPEKAKLVIKSDKKPKDAKDIECMFNPTEYSLTQTVSVQRRPSPSTPGGVPQYGGTNTMKFNATLFFDEFSLPHGDITPKISRLLSWTMPIESLRQDNKPCPPLVGFQWGKNPQLDNFRGFLTSVGIRYQLFRRDGTPVRAEVTIEIAGESLEFGQSAPATAAGQNPTSRATNTTRTHTMVEGESIHSVAYGELGKAAYWRAIADLNDIDDPMRVSAGTVLLIPSVADAVKGS